MSRSLKNRFIVFEGLDGSGKTTLRRMLFEKMSRETVMPLSIVGSSWQDLRSTELITKARYHHEHFSPSDICNAYLTDRLALCSSLICPALTQRSVLSDRYLYSDIIYNEMHYSIPFGQTEAVYLEAIKLGKLRSPDVIVYVFCPPELAMERIQLRKKPVNKWETFRNVQTIFAGFSNLFEAGTFGWSNRTYTIDNSGSLESAFESLIQSIDFDTDRVAKISRETQHG
jgi:dTMP kinase